ncbi:vacuolar sorting protein 39 [Aristolochia californica]|uniref:vacuolar sorting protein 39 n=1 Tax=Aristolochia californica TaxID=171875 RepID=UPI0035DFADCB
MVHTAYDSQELLKNYPAKIQCIGSDGSNLLLGCNDGSLHMCAPQSDDRPLTSSDHHIRREPYVLEKAIKGFSKKLLMSLEVSPSRNLLISLSESIAFHRLPGLEPLAVIGKSKGANVYAWDDRRGFLCFGRQKRVGIFRHEGGRDFVEVKEFNVPDVVKSMAWCGENICLAIRREYMILNGTNGVLSEVFPSGIAPPLVVPLPSGELLLGKDNIGVFVDQKGKLLKDGRICWSDAPASIVIHMHFAIARLPRYVEIRSLRPPYPLVQTVHLRDVRHLVQTKDSVIALLENFVYGLFPVPLGAQIVQLTVSANFEEALSLCKLLPPEDSTLRAAKEDSIHIRYGMHLFNNGSYEEAMEQFLASSADITHILSLYPFLVLPKVISGSEPDNIFDLASEHLSRASSDASDEMESLSPSQDSERSSLEIKKMSHNALMALTKYLQKKRFGIIEKATAEITEEVVSDAVTSYDANRSKASNKGGRSRIQINSSARETASILDTALLQSLLLTGQTSAAFDLLKALNYCDIKISEEFLRQRNHHMALLELYKCNNMHHEALKLLTQLVEESNTDPSESSHGHNIKSQAIIDYLKPLCSTDPMLVLEFSLHALESCPVETIELFLSGNIPPDLVNSYLKQHAPQLQATYLELMLATSESTISSNLQNELVQIYLSEVLDWYADLKAHNKWEEKEYSPARKKLLGALEGISGNNADILLKRLPSDALYEERALLLGKLNQHQLALSLYVHKLHMPHLALAYCDRVYKAGEYTPSSKSNTSIYLTLLQIYLNPRKATKEFERRSENAGSQQRTTGFQKANLFKAKGSRVSKKIAEIEGAEDIRISPSGTDSGRSDYDGDEPQEDGGPIMLDETLDLLSRKWDRINGAQALKLLPRETKLQNLLPFLEPLLKKSSEGCRNFSVIKSLRHSENLQVKDEFYKHRRMVVKITSNSMCSLCNKRIGTSVFAVYPNGKTLVHFVCFRDSQNIKAGRGTQLKKRN